MIVSSGLQINWNKIKGAKEALDDPSQNVVSIYDFNYASKTSQKGAEFKGGKAIFTEPPMPIKCAGAPQKILYLWTNQWQKNNIPVDVEFYKTVGVMFAVPKYASALTRIAANYNIQTTFLHQLVEVKENKAIF